MCNNKLKFTKKCKSIDFSPPHVKAKSTNHGSGNIPDPIEQTRQKQAKELGLPLDTPQGIINDKAWELRRQEQAKELNLSQS